MNRYDKDHDGKLKFQEFCEIVAPKNPPKYIASLIRNKFKINPESGTLCKATIDSIKQVLESSIKLEMDLEMVRFRI